MAFNAEDYAEFSSWNATANGRSLNFGVDTSGLAEKFDAAGQMLAAGQEPTVFQYPLDMMMEKTDHLSIKIFEQTRSKDVFGLDKAEQVKGVDNVFRIKSYTDEFNNPDNQKKLEKNAKFIFLPIPQQISDAISVSYAEDTLNPLQTFGLNATNELLNSKNILGTTGDLLNNMISAGLNIDSKTKDVMTKALSGQAINSFGANVNPMSLVTRASGQILQSNLELLFSGVTLRSFPFVYDFAPRDPREAEVVKGIIRTLKKAMTAKNGRNGLFINSPDVFQLEYKSGNKNHPFLNMFKVCSLSDLAVNYTASGTYATYGDGSPVHIQVQMTFKEINPVYSEDYDILSEGGYKNVGY